METNVNFDKIQQAFDCPKSTLWKMWSDEQQLKKWFGPENCSLVYAKMDFRVGGKFHYAMEMPNGFKMWCFWMIREIDEENGKLVIGESMTDEKGEHAISNPNNPNWPLEIITTIQFSEKNGQSIVEMEWSAGDVSDDQKQAFADGKEYMKGGWKSTLNKLQQKT